MSRTVMWFRRDLRLADNPALADAAADGEVLGLFVVDPAFAAAGAPRRAFLAGCLRALDDAMGGTLVVREGDPADVVPAVAAAARAPTVVAAHDFGPYGQRRDEAVAAALAADGCSLRLIGSPYAVEPGSVTKADGTPYAVFTPFHRAWRAAGIGDPIAPPTVDWWGPGTVSGRAFPAVGDGGIDGPEPGEAAAARRADVFLSGPVADYGVRRDRPDLDGTSRLSPYLHLGAIHPRQLLARLGRGKGPATFARELVWREFYADVLFHRPESAWETLQPRLRALRWDHGARAHAHFATWCRGRTGYPMVDAGLRQLRATGWMHNRLRMLTASFLVKDLHLPWQWGAAYFLRHLVDGDLASNNHGWQWTAGTGTDPSPFVRVFNPVVQGERFDPEGDYVRHWVPELADRPAEAIHRPLTALESAACGYPEPMVDHAAERTETLRRWDALRG